MQHSRPTIGLLIDWVEGGYQSAIWSGVADAAREQDINLLCFVGGPLHSPYGFDAQRNVVYDLIDTHSIDGLVITMGTLGNFIDLEESKSFCERYRPLPMVSIALALENTPSILVDNKTGMYEVVTHLIEVHGRHRIAYIRGPEGVRDADQRYRAYTDALAEHNLPFDPELVASGDFIRVTGSAAIHLLLDERKVSFDAVVAANDDMALGALEALQARGIQVPDDVTVIGFDDTEEARSSPLPMTTVRQPIYKLGRQAVEMVLAQLKGEEIPECVTIPSELVIRGSCGCLDQAVAQASAGLETRSSITTATRETVKAALEAQREHIVAEMVQAVPTSPFPQEKVSHWAGQLLDAFTVELESESPGVLLQALDKVLYQVRARGGNISAWHSAVSILRRSTLESLADCAIPSWIEDVWQRAQVLIGKTSEQAQAYRMLRAQEQSDALRIASQILGTTFDVTELMDVTASELPQLGIERCYLSLYEQSRESKIPPEWSRLILAYDKTGRIELESSGLRFPSHQLVPNGILHREKRFSLLVETLFFREEQIGFVLFEVNPQRENVHEVLRGQISSALKGALLFQEHERRATELAIVNEIGQAISSARQMDELLETVYQQVGRLFDTTNFYIALYNSDKDEVTFALDVAKGITRKFIETRQAGQGLTEYIIRNQTSLLIQENLPKRLEEMRIEPIGTMALSWLGVPLVIGGHVVGVMAVQSYTTPRAYDEHDLETLTAIASQTAVAVHNAQLYEQAQYEISERRRAEEEAQRRAAQAALIYQIGQRVSGELELEVLLSEIVAAIHDAFDYHNVLLMLLDKQSDTLTLQAIAGGYTNLFPNDLSLDIGEGMIGYTAATGEPQISGDVRKDPHYVRKASEITKSELAVPITSGQEIIGVLDLQSDELDVFDETDVMLMETLADQIASAIENARLYEEAQQRLRELSVLFDASQHLASAPLQAEKIAKIAAYQLAGAMGTTECSLSLLDSQKGTLQSIANFWIEDGVEHQEEIRESFNLSDYPATAQVIETLNPLVVQASDPNADPAELAYMQKNGSATLAIVPLAVKGQAIGVMELETWKERHYTPEQLNMAMTLANQAAVALENARLYEAMQQELSERERAEEALAHERDLLHALMDNTPDAIYFKDVDSRFVRVNRTQAQVLLGANDPDKAIGKTDFDFFTREHAQDAYEDEQEIVRSGQPLIDKLEQIRRADGQIRWVSTTKVPLISKGGQVAGTIGITRDITERKQAEEQLQRYAAEMERANEEVKKFAYIVSHDLRAPLVNLKGFAAELDIALKDIQSVIDTALPHLSEDQRQTIAYALHKDVPESLRFINSSVEHMDSFISALLKLSRLGRRELKLEQVNMNGIVDAILSTLAHQIAEHQVEVKVEQLPNVIADRTSMEQVMSNILGNAVKYLTSDRPAEIKVTAERNDDETIFRIQDNGCGIAESDIENVFTPFRRAGKQDVPGEGMGLAYVQTLVRRHGGRVWCESELGTGTTFTFTLPNRPKGVDYA